MGFTISKLHPSLPPLSALSRSTGTCITLLNFSLRMHCLPEFQLRPTMPERLLRFMVVQIHGAHHLPDRVHYCTNGHIPLHQISYQCQQHQHRRGNPVFCGPLIIFWRIRVLAKKRFYRGPMKVSSYLLTCPRNIISLIYFRSHS